MAQRVKVLAFKSKDLSLISQAPHGGRSELTSTNCLLIENEDMTYGYVDMREGSLKESRLKQTIKGEKWG